MRYIIARKSLISMRWWWCQLWFDWFMVFNATFNNISVIW